MLLITLTEKITLTLRNQFENEIRPRLIGQSPSHQRDIMPKSC